MSRSKQNFDHLVRKDGSYVLKFDHLGRIQTAIAPEVLSDGPEGPQGEAGLDGDKGEKGDQGIKGDTTSAYHPKEAVANAAALPTDGNTPGDVRLTIDTQEFHVWGGSSWTNAGSVVPVKGDKGEVGVDGTKGEIGVTGAQGVKGDGGDKGATGDKGDLGTKGDLGEKGDKGQKGTPADATQYFTKGESDIRYTQIEGDAMTGRLDIDLSDETAAALRIRGGFAMKMKGESIGGDNLFYSSSDNNSVSYEGITTADDHIVNKKYVDDALTANIPNLSSYYTGTQTDNLFVAKAGGTMTGRLTVNASGTASVVTDGHMYAGTAYRLAENGTINHDNKPKIQITQEGVTIIDVSAENSSKTHGFKLEGYTENGNGTLLQAMHPQSGYDSIYYYGKITDGFHLATKSYVDTTVTSQISIAVDDYVTQTQVDTQLSSYATQEDLEAAAPVGNEILPPVIVNDLTFANNGGVQGNGPTSATSGPPIGELYGFNGNLINKFLGNWTTIKIHKDSFLEPPAADTTEANENRIFEFYDKSNNVLAYKFVAKSVTKYGDWWLIEKRFKMIAVGQATGQVTRGVLF